MDKKELKWLEELCEDAEVHSQRISQWEASFMATLYDKLMEYGDRAYVSERELEIVKRVERRMYAT